MTEEHQLPEDIRLTLLNLSYKINTLKHEIGELPGLLQELEELLKKNGFHSEETDNG
jgi:hypothetical protein